MIDYGELDDYVLRLVRDELKRQRRNAEEGLIESLDEADVAKTYEDDKGAIWSHRRKSWGYEFCGSEWHPVYRASAYDNDGPFTEVAK